MLVTSLTPFPQSVPTNSEPIGLPVAVNCSTLASSMGKLLPPCSLPAFSSWHGLQCLQAVKSPAWWSEAWPRLHLGHFPCFPGDQERVLSKSFLKVKIGLENVMKPHQSPAKPVIYCVCLVQRTTTKFTKLPFQHCSLLSFT